MEDGRHFSSPYWSIAWWVASAATVSPLLVLLAKHLLQGATPTAGLLIASFILMFGWFIVLPLDRAMGVDSYSGWMRDVRELQLTMLEYAGPIVFGGVGVGLAISAV